MFTDDAQVGLLCFSCFSSCCLLQVFLRLISITQRLVLYYFSLNLCRNG